MLTSCKSVWRISEDGEVRDTFKKLSYIFQMKECTFFSHYVGEKCFNSYYQECCNEKKTFLSKIQELPFSNEWIARELCQCIPTGSVVHLGIFNTLRSWNMNDVTQDIDVDCNVGGFGIDGALSTSIGASLATPQKIHFCCCGDLAFFYDMNSLCNRHVGKNIRILVINNGRGVEFRNYSHPAYIYGEYADSYIAAGGHNGNQSKDLIKNYVEALGFLYYSANSKEEFNTIKNIFTDSKMGSKPILLEVFTKTEDESNSLKTILTTCGEKNSLKEVAKKIVGKEGKRIIKSLLK